MTHTLVINDHHLRMLMRSSFPHYTDEERADLLKMFLNSVSAANSQEPPKPTFYVPSDFMTTKYGPCAIAATYRGDPDGICTRGLYAEPLASDNMRFLVKQMVEYLREIIAEDTYGEHTKNLVELVNEATAWLERGVEPDPKPLPDARNLPAWLIKSVENLYTEFMSVQQSILDKNGMTFDEMFKLRGLIGALLDRCRGQRPSKYDIVVKQLEWVHTSNMWQAGQYKITRQGIGTYILAGTSAIVRNPWSDLASAKRAAQHDFETETLRRIASPVEPLSDAQIACQELLEAARLIKHVVSYDVLFNAINEAVKLDKTRKVISVEDFRNYISDTVERIIRKAGGGA